MSRQGNGQKRKSEHGTSARSTDLLNAVKALLTEKNLGFYEGDDGRTLLLKFDLGAEVHIKHLPRDEKPEILLLGLPLGELPAPKQSAKKSSCFESILERNFTRTVGRYGLVAKNDSIQVYLEATLFLDGPTVSSDTFHRVLQTLLIEYATFGHWVKSGFSEWLRHDEIVERLKNQEAEPSG